MQPTTTAELFAIKDGMKAVDVHLCVQLVKEPVNIFSSNKGKSYRILELHAASSRGDLIKVIFWNEDIDRLAPQLREGALLRFQMFKAQKIISQKFRVGTFDISLMAQMDSTVSIAIEKFKLKPLPLSNLRDIDMNVTCRHRLGFQITQQFVSRDQGLIGYGIVHDTNWTATNVTAQIVLSQNAPLLRYILAVKNRVMITGTVGRSGSIIEMAAQSVKDVEIAKPAGSAESCMVLPSSSKSVSSISSDGERILAKHINEFAGLHLSGYVTGVVLDQFEFEGETFKGELLVEDAEVATLPVVLAHVAITEGQSFVTDARVQIHGRLQFGPDRELEFAATADGVRFLDDCVAEDAPASDELSLFSAADLFGMTSPYVTGIVEGTLMKPFAVSNDVAVGLLRVKGTGRSVILRVSLQFETGPKISASFERGSQLRLIGLISRENENSSMLDVDVMVEKDVCLQGAVDSPSSTPATTPATTPKEVVSFDRSLLRNRQPSFEPPCTPTLSKKIHTGHSPVKEETSPGMTALIAEALFEEGERAGKRRSTILRELYTEQGKKMRPLQLDSDSD